MRKQEEVKDIIEKINMSVDNGKAINLFDSFGLISTISAERIVAGTTILYKFENNYNNTTEILGYPKAMDTLANWGFDDNFDFEEVES